MKITIAYIPGEESEAILIRQFSNAVLGGVRVHENDRHPPFKHIYLTSKNAGNSSTTNKSN